MTADQPIGFLNTGMPILVLFLVTVVLPFLWAMVLPEGILGLVANFALSALVISGLVFAYFINWHMGRNAELTEALLAQPGAFWTLFLGWAGKTALFWLPVLVLAVAAQPRRWKEVVW